MGKLAGRHRMLAALGAGAVLIVTGAVPAAATGTGRPQARHPGRQALTLAVPGRPRLAPAARRPRGSGQDTTCSAAFYHGDKRLGPEHLPTAGVLGEILHGYDRFGGLSADAFLARFWDPAIRDWFFPPQNGYVLDASSHADVFHVWMTRGLRMDRFGRVTGRFLSPYGQPFAIRALPPQNLDGVDCNYHAYLVLKRFLVDAGPVARWYRQPGYGFQYVLNPLLVPHAPEWMNVRWLVGHGFLQPIR